MNKKNIAVVMGGYSSEFEISLNSGAVVCESLDTDKYKVYPVHILKEGWFYIDENGAKHAITKDDFSFTANDTKIIPDVIFNTVHGTPGEDGLLQAYWQLLNIKQTSPSYYPSALSFDKRDCLSVLKGFGVQSANSYYINKGVEFSIDDVIKKVGLPCFVKPNRAGSSYGISKVKTINDFDAALQKAFTEDHQVLVETALIGTEVSVGAYTVNGEVRVLIPTEIVSENDFFDYEAKYLGKSEEITPARISDEETEKVQAETARIYKLLNMKGVVRCDFIIEKGTPYFIEINTTPGLSKESIIPKQVRAGQMTLTAFFGTLIEEALS